MLQVKKIVGTLHSSNMYLLYEEGIVDCYLIDIGDSSALAEELPDDMNVKGVFLTHSHFYHMAGIYGLCKMFPECKYIPRSMARMHCTPTKRISHSIMSNPLSIMAIMWRCSMMEM